MESASYGLKMSRNRIEVIHVGIKPNFVLVRRRAVRVAHPLTLADLTSRVEREWALHIGLDYA